MFSLADEDPWGHASVCSGIRAHASAQARPGTSARAQRGGTAARKALGIAAHAPLDPWAYAVHLNVSVLDLKSLTLPGHVARQLTEIDPDSWSAMTLKEGDALAIVINPAHALTRQRSDLMHELAHIELRHVPARVDVSKTGLLLISDYSDEQEQEADWHAAALLLPRIGLLRLRSQNRSAAEIAAYYGVSKGLCDWRLRMTGVDIQMRRAFAR
jgi:IrrE N-terminal-like domain